MPVLNGWQFLSQLEKNNTSKIIILTSSLDPEDTERAKEFEQVISYQIKPTSKELLKNLLL